MVRLDGKLIFATVVAAVCFAYFGRREWLRIGMLLATEISGRLRIK